MSRDKLKQAAAEAALAYIDDDYVTSAAAYTSAASYAAYAADYTADLEYWLKKYFTLTGEDRAEYQKEADK